MKRILCVIICMLAAVTVARSQTECEAMLKAADEYFSKGDFEKAAKEYQLVQECSHDINYGGAATKLSECRYKLKEDDDFGKCTTVSACDDYLNNYRDGRYVDRVQQIRAEIIKASVNAAEDDNAFQNCFTEEDFLDYVKRYPYGRHVTQAKAVLAQFEEDRVYANCYTESDYNAYLKKYPNGKYYSEAMEQLRVFEEERLRKEREAAKTAYMNIRSVDFANTHSTGAIIDPYGATLYVDKIQYVTARLSYDARLDEVRQIALFCRIYRPNGSMLFDSNSPGGYTYSHIFKVEPGYGNVYELPSWGSYDDGYFDAGTYRYELWYDGSRVYQTSFEVVDKNTNLSRGNWRTALLKCCDYVSHSSENGSSYKGQYENYRRSGLGMYSWKGVFYYIGSWDFGNKEGLGIEIAASGSSFSDCPECGYYVGEYSNDKKSGIGSCYNMFGDLIYYGNFENDKPTQAYPMSGFDNYKFECIAYSWGDYYVGETYNGKPQGQGIYIWSNGDMWYGKYYNGQRDGYGILMPYQGPFSTGIWKGNIKE